MFRTFLHPLDQNQPPMMIDLFQQNKYDPKDEMRKQIKREFSNQGCWVLLLLLLLFERQYVKVPSNSVGTDCTKPWENVDHITVTSL